MEYLLYILSKLVEVLCRSGNILQTGEEGYLPWLDAFRLNYFCFPLPSAIIPMNKADSSAVSIRSWNMYILKPPLFRKRIWSLYPCKQNVISYQGRSLSFPSFLDRHYKFHIRSHDFLQTLRRESCAKDRNTVKMQLIKHALQRFYIQLGILQQTDENRYVLTWM